MYELIILILLMRTPAHGYLISHIINDIIGPYARVSNGRLYPLLARLEESGMIEANEDAGQQRGERNARSYRITEAGRERFHTLMLDTTSNPGEYQRIFLQKVPMLSYLKPSERLYLIDHYINYCQAHVLHLTAEGDDLEAGNYHRFPGDEWVLPATLDVMNHMADQWRLEVAWALRLREQHLADQKGTGPSKGRLSGVDQSDHVKQREQQKQQQRWQKRQQKIQQHQQRLNQNKNQNQNRNDNQN